MANEEIIDYITQETAKGTSKDTIIYNLKAVGWQENDIDKMFNQAFPKVEAPEMPKPEALPEKAAQPQKKKGMPKLIVLLAIVLLVAASAVYFLMFYPSCPKFVPPDFSQWGNALIAHPWENRNNYEDIIDLNMEIGSSNMITAGGRWKNYLASYNFGKYDIVNVPDGQYWCWKGDEVIKQDPSLNYCPVLLRKKGSDEEKVLWVRIIPQQVSPVLASFAPYPGFSAMNWTAAKISYKDSYCRGSVIPTSPSQSTILGAKNDLFSPGTIMEHSIINPSTATINITNGLGAGMIVKNITLGSCGKSTDEVVNDKETGQFILEGCANGATGSMFSGNITINYIISGSTSLQEFSSVMTAEIAAEENAEEAEESIPLTNPCYDPNKCIGLVYNHGGQSSFAWNGSEYGMAWQHENSGSSTLYFMRFSSTGNMTGNEIKLGTYSANSKRPSIAWTGSGYNIAWPVGSALYFMMLDAEGNKLSEIKLKDVSASATFADYIDSASIAWAGNESGVAWSESSGRSHFARIDENGQRIVPDMEIGITSSRYASVVWIGSEYGVGWIETSATDKRDLLARITPEEGKISTIKLEGSLLFCDYLALAWADSRYGLASSCFADKEAKDEELYFTRIHSTGGRAEMIELDQAKAKISSSASSGHTAKDPSLAMTSDGYGMAWRDNRDGNDEIYFALIDSYTGSQVKEELRITDSLPESGFPSIVSVDSGYGLIWTETDGEKQHVYFMRVG